MDRDYQQSTRRVRKQAAKTLDKMPWIAGGLLGLLALIAGMVLHWQDVPHGRQAAAAVLQPART